MYVICYTALKTDSLKQRTARQTTTVNEPNCRNVLFAAIGQSLLIIFKQCILTSTFIRFYIDVKSIAYSVATLKSFYSVVLLFKTSIDAK